MTWWVHFIGILMGALTCWFQLTYSTLWPHPKRLIALRKLDVLFKMIFSYKKLGVMGRKSPPQHMCKFLLELIAYFVVRVSSACLVFLPPPSFCVCSMSGLWGSAGTRFNPVSPARPLIALRALCGRWNPFRTFSILRRVPWKNSVHLIHFLYLKNCHLRMWRRYCNYSLERVYLDCIRCSCSNTI